MRYCSILAIAIAAMQVAASGAETVSFNRDVKPILSDRCFACHGTDRQEANLRLDVRDSAVGVAIEAGNATASELLARVTATDESLVMPPAESHKPRLTAQEIDILRRWIDEGATYQQHWSFVPPQRDKLPQTNDKSWPANQIDHFVLANLEAAGMSPAADADRRTLIRRATLDLTGVPPTREEVNRFVADRSPDAFEKVVDRLLASPRYAEQRARYWLDVARYADTNGYQYDLEREQWVWRDWVIHAFDSNMPWDRFTVLQMAGDLLPDATDETRLATGFHRNHPITIEGGVIDEEYRTEYVMDRVATTSTAWLGLTLHCARCHDHKYDPLSQHDFFALYACFNNVPEKGHNGFDPSAKILSPLADAQIHNLREQLEQVDREIVNQLNNVSQLEFDRWQQQLVDYRDAWSIVREATLNAAHGTTLSIDFDGNIVAGGAKPDQETYELVFTSGTNPVRGLRLEVLPDDALVGGSVGRAHNGNMVLSEVTVEVGHKERLPVAIEKAEADYEQSGYPAAHAIDGKLDSNGWAVDGNVRAKPSTLVLTLAEPIPGRSTITVRLSHNFGAAHTLGRFRLSTIGPEAPVSLGLRPEKSPSARRGGSEPAEHRTALARRFGSERLRQLYDQQTKLTQQIAEINIPATLIMQEAQTPRPCYVLDRGEYDKPIKDRPVVPGVPEVLGPWPEGAPRNRLGLAMWMTDRANPLTARVAVNQFWAQLFGQGLVSTLEDFGSQGAYPSHPELLDWLAVEFMESGWDVKHLFKLMVTSRTYQQSSMVSPQQLERDPANRLLARGPRYRLDAEAIRDSALAAGGLLDQRLGGPSVFPYHPQGLWQEINNRPGLSRVYPHTTAAEHLYRRSLYTFWKRTVAPPSLATFDAPEREYCVVQRSRTNTPLQALVLLHDPQFVEASRALAQRMLLEGGPARGDQIAFGLELCVARQPTPQELATLTATFEQSLRTYQNDLPLAERLLSIGVSPRDESIDIAEHAAMTDVARLMLNLSEFITKN